MYGKRCNVLSCSAAAAILSCSATAARFFLALQALQCAFLFGNRCNILSRPTEIPPLLDGLRALN
ncbi:hypothetical protein, partial [Achromobacter pestifer]|uniref:hypothetical protein n=1 Tax=Achromobacter pestifer TaxID=1353889 RepID=UPI001C2EB9FA